MKRLILLRHAKSAWDRPELDDHDRPLAPRGRRAAPAMARWLRAREIPIDRVLSSDSVRTRETWSLVAECWGEGAAPPVRFDPELYLASPRRILARVAASGDGGTVLVIGHNPGLHDLACTLAAPGATDAHRRLARKFPTAAVAILEFDVDRWEAVEPGEGRLVAFQRPKDLPQAEEAGL